MANIMLTDNCNLKCSYCFANEFVNRDKNEISDTNFEKAVNFITKSNRESTVGLIGGEPTTHSKFGYFLKKLILNERVKRIVVYTNGLLLDKYFNLLGHQKVCLLVNCNSPDDIGQKQYEKLCRNLDYLMDECLLQEQITLGINVYKENIDYSFILALLKKYHCNRVRVSITVPNIETDRNMDVHEHFIKMKPIILAMFQEFLENGIVPHFDCNKIPACLVTEEEIECIRRFYSNAEIKTELLESNISNSKVRCTPVVDIMQDLTAVRCFGLSEYTKTHIEEFSDLNELINYYIRTVDAYAYNTVYTQKCIECHSREVMNCVGGCMAFKINEIMRIREFSEKLLQSHNQ